MEKLIDAGQITNRLLLDYQSFTLDWQATNNLITVSGTTHFVLGCDCEATQLKDVARRIKAG